jgi:two-component sensor histidine kinase
MPRRRWLRIGLYFAIWIVLGTIATTTAYEFRRMWGRDVTWSSVARVQFTFYASWALVLTPIILWVCRRYPIEKVNWVRRLVIHIATALFLVALDAALRLPLYHFVYPKEKAEIGWRLYGAYLLGEGYDDLWMYAVIAFLCHAYLYYQRYVDRERRASQLEAQLARAQLDMLKMQLHPHFLFNTLHSISALMHKDIELADRLIARLSDLLRMTLENSDDQEIPLSRELEFLKGYLEIEQTRFQDRLRVRFDIDPACLHARVPTLILQPLVENAVRHGIAPNSRPGLVEIAAHRSHGRLTLTVTDDGAGIRSTARHGTGLGLTNVQTRLKSHYGLQQRFEVTSPAGGGTFVTLELPFVPEKCALAHRAEW